MELCVIKFPRLDALSEGNRTLMENGAEKHIRKSLTVIMDTMNWRFIARNLFYGDLAGGCSHGRRV